MEINTAKKLTELGWNKETEKYWFQNDNGWFKKPATFKEAEYAGYQKPYYYCPSTDEILEELPYSFSDDEDRYWFRLEKDMNKSYFAYYEDSDFGEKNNNLNEALALLWIDLKERKII